MQRTMQCRRAPVLGVVLAFSTLVAGCGSSAIKTDVKANSVAVADAAAGADSGKSVLWGGVILGSQNLANGTQLEVLAYPLDRTQRPRTGADGTGRFMVMTEGFLEPVDYASGRSITVLGTLESTVDGQVGETRYTYPLVNASELHLWTEKEAAAPPRLTFGIGINL